ncbi:MAG: glycosyltransferase [Alphaproteobacteria bacterium]|jgi:GT2 family glycosyltransferase|nr:glycosyltransferase [Alphaproteobacteria bacterium]
MNPDAVFVALTPTVTAVLLTEPVRPQPDDPVAVNDRAVRRWTVRTFTPARDRKSGKRVVAILVTDGPDAGSSDGRAPDETVSTDGRLVVAAACVAKGPRLSDLARFAEMAEPAWVEALAAALLLDGLSILPDAVAPRDRVDLGAVLRQIEAPVVQTTGAIALGEGAAVVELPAGSLSAGARLFDPAGSRPAALNQSRVALAGGRSLWALASGSGAPLADELLAVESGRGELCRLRLANRLAGGIGAIDGRYGKAGAGTAFRIRDALGTVQAGLRDPDVAQRLGRQLVGLQYRQGVKPRTIDDPALGISADLVAAVPVGDEGVFLSGTMCDPEGLVERLSLRGPDGAEHALDGRLRWFPVAKAGSDTRPGTPRGFAGYLPLDRHARYIRQIRLDVGAVGQTRHTLVSPVWRGTAADARRAVLGAIPPLTVGPDDFANALHPALRTLQKEVVGRKRVVADTRFGVSARKPAVSLIIPLYREYGFIRHQVQAWALDRDFEDAEVVYVLDSPEDARSVSSLLWDLNLVYGLPLRLIILDANYGYAGATNIGGMLARGRTLVLLNSDVVPRDFGWLGQWTAQHGAIPGIGVSGVRLLFADGSLQHAGMRFDKALMPWWINRHYDKGLPADTTRALSARPVPAVTGAAAMIDRGLFRRLGGLCEEYVIGDFEDSDLCLRVRAAGFGIHYFPNPVLYHFERKSITRNTDYCDTVAAQYNGWLQTRKHGDAIEAVVAEESAGLFDAQIAA